MKYSAQKEPQSAKAKPRGKPFVSGDPRSKPGSGRPPTPKCIPDLLRWAGSMKAPDKVVAEMRKVFNLDGDLTVDQATILVVRMMALQGEMKAIEFIADRTEGKALQSIAVDDRRIEPLVAIVSREDFERMEAEDAAKAHAKTTPLLVSDIGESGQAPDPA